MFAGARVIVLGIASLLAPVPVQAEVVPTVSLTDDTVVDLGAQAQILDGDPVSADDPRFPPAVRQAWLAARPAPLRNRFYSSRWLVVKLANPAGSGAEHWVLRMDTDPLYLPILVVLDDNRVMSVSRRDDATTARLETGSAFAIGQRFAITIPSGDTRTVALRVSAVGYGSLAANMLTAAAYLRWAVWHQAVVMVALTLIAALGLYNLSLGIGLRSATHLWYAALAAACVVYWTTLLGIAADLFGVTDPDRVLCKLSSSAAFAVPPFFVRALLGTSAFAPRIDRVLWWCGVSGLAILSVTPLLSVWPEGQQAWVRGPEYQYLPAIVEAALFIVVGVTAVRRGIPGAGWFLAGWLPYLVASLLTIMASYGVWRFSGTWLMVALLGITWEAVMFSQALTGRLQVVHNVLSTAGAQRKVQESLLASISHEFRTPLHAILGMTRTLEREPLPQRTMTRVHAIRRAGEGLLTLVSDLLDRAALRTGRLQLHSAAISLSAIAEEVGDLVAYQAAAKGLVFRVAASASALPLFWADGQRLKTGLAQPCRQRHQVYPCRRGRSGH